MNSFTPDQLSALDKYNKTKEYLIKRSRSHSAIRINHFSLITDVKKYLDVHFKTIEHAKPLSRVFIVHYYRLYELRQFFLKIDKDAKQSK